MSTEFKHLQSAHCENGVTTSLLKYHGVEWMTEPLAFGLGSGLFYIHIPFMKISHGPAISFRTAPGLIFKRTCKALDIQVTRKKFRNVDKARDYLDMKVAEGAPVGCQVGVFDLTYFSEEYRFHFNGHNLIVYGKDGDEYLVSDPVMEDVTRLTVEDMDRVRFAKGPLAPKGHVYFPTNVGEVDKELLRAGIVKGIKRNVRDMLHIPGNIAGFSGIKYTAKKIRKLLDKEGPRNSRLYLGQVVRMQEEIGTGGGGFRFMYGAFLEQAAEHLQNDKLLPLSEEITKAGDLWRASAVQMAGIYKGKYDTQKAFDDVADLMIEISELEKATFKKLADLKL